MCKFRLSLLAYLTVALLSARVAAQQTQIEHSRQLEVAREVRSTDGGILSPGASVGADLESFGTQQILIKGPDRTKHFSAYGEISVFGTNNVGLSHQNPISDSYLTADIGLAYRRPISKGLTFESAFEVALFRYHNVSELDFNSLDFATGVRYRLHKFWGIDLSARYQLSVLQNVSSGNAFYQNHALVLGAQKVVEMNRRNSLFVGITGKIGFTDPSSSERDEAAVYAGYDLQLLRSLEAEAGYRYAYYAYTDGGRRDHNQTASLGLRYRLSECLSASFSSFYTWDASNQVEASYSAGSIGGSLLLLLRF